MAHRAADERSALKAEVGSHAVHADDQLDAPWSTEALRQSRAELRAMDVCGAMADCAEGTCPCAALGEDPT